MKKILMILLAVSLAISLIACGESAELPSLAEISAFSDQRITDILSGLSVEDIHAAYGEPDGSTFGFWADIYEFPDSSKVVFVYYNADGMVETVKTDYQNE